MTPAELLKQLRGLQQPDVLVDQPTQLMVNWPILGGAVFVLMFGFTIWWRAHTWQREARAELKAIENLAARGRSDIAWQRMAVLLRRVAMHVSDDPDVSKVTGEPWLTLLDKTFGTQCFGQGQGRALLKVPYQTPGNVSTNELAPLIDAVRVALPRLRPIKQRRANHPASQVRLLND